MAVALPAPAVTPAVFAMPEVTVGASFMAQTVALPDATTVKFEIWDTAGQERYASLAPLYYRGASAAVIIFDITSEESFHKAKFWVQELHKHGSQGVVMALVGNKSDLEELREVAPEEAREYAESNNMLFLETSAKTAANIAEVFEQIGMRLAQGGEPIARSESSALPRSEANTTSFPSRAR
eukprot:SM000083S22798  [mRNA]  locus=s83:408965:410897:- [translate_table: standard]